LRLSLPTETAQTAGLISPELRGAAIIREVHVYGPSLRLGSHTGHAQHQGLGTRLLGEAERVACEAGFHRLSVISAIGTRSYYRSRGFALDDLYMHREVR
jgi:elongator complex protein 3